MPIDLCGLHHLKCVLSKVTLCKSATELLSNCIIATAMDVLIFGSYKECLRYYAYQQLLESRSYCRLCGTIMDLTNLKVSWKCTNGSCCTLLTLLHSS